MLPGEGTCSPPCSIQNQQTANIRAPVQFRTIVYIVYGFVVVLTVAVVDVVLLAVVVVPVLVVAVLVFVDVDVDVVFVDVAVVLAELTASEFTHWARRGPPVDPTIF